MTLTAGARTRTAAAAPSGGLASRPAAERISRRLWNLDWGTILPWTLGDVRVELGTFDEVLPFIQARYVELFGAPDARFVVEEMTDARRMFWSESDVFVLRRGGQVVGFWGGHPSDWSTYYCRSMSILPELRGERLATELASRVCETLAATAAERIELDTSVANVPVQRLLLGLGFLVTATMSSERWGAVLRFTKHLRADAARVFATQFVNVPRFDKSSR